MASYTQLTLVGLTVMALLSSITAQNFHFSNGWHPGKRSEIMASACSFRPHIKNLLLRIIEDEVKKMIRCSASNADNNVLNSVFQNKLVDLPLQDVMQDEN